MTVRSAVPFRCQSAGATVALDAFDCREGLGDRGGVARLRRARRTARAARCRFRSRSRLSSAIRAGPCCASEFARGFPNWIVDAATTSAPRTAEARSREPAVPDDEPCPRRPRTAGASVSPVARPVELGADRGKHDGEQRDTDSHADKAIRRPAIPMLRRAGIGSASNAISEMPTVVPLKTTAEPACCIAFCTAWSFVMPGRCRSSRQRTTISSA